MGFYRVCEPSALEVEPEAEWAYHLSDEPQSGSMLPRPPTQGVVRMVLDQEYHSGFEGRVTCQVSWLGRACGIHHVGSSARV